MSVKVPYESVEYQSHNHCQCDFCNSRRAVNAKKWALSQRALQAQHAKLRNGYDCTTVSAADLVNYAKERHPTDFNPEYPDPVNQTALNAARGRTGVAGGNAYTTRNATTRPTVAPTAARTKDEDAAATMQELDRLERLLILEHKARVKAALEADKLGVLRSTGKELHPQPLPDDLARRNRVATAGRDVDLGGGYDGSAGGPLALNGSTYRGESLYPGASFERASPVTIREAFELAHDCPVTPPVRCHASTRLQDTINDIRMVAMDPVNPHGRTALQRVVEGRPALAEVTTPLSDGTAAATRNEFGDTLAANRTTNQHPHGAGVVWSSKNKLPPLQPDGVATNTSATQTNSNSNNKSAEMSEDRRLATGNGATALPPGAAAALSVANKSDSGRDGGVPRRVRYAL